MKKLARKTASLTAIATGLVLGLHVSVGLAVPAEVHQSIVSEGKGLQSFLVLAASDREDGESRKPGTGLDR
ncbi:MAG: hypothetical protein WBC69_22460 [Geitlerinemataceae cyanobacterium]